MIQRYVQVSFGDGEEGLPVILSGVCSAGFFLFQKSQITEVPRWLGLAEYGTQAAN